MPWSYELGYLALLYQIGLVGLLAYAAAVLWVFRRCIESVRVGGEYSRLMIAMLVGLSSALLAHGVDPYLDRFDGMWMFFLPLGALNFWLLAGKAKAPGIGRVIVQRPAEIR
jgi:O-antigen ligase